MEEYSELEGVTQMPGPRPMASTVQLLAKGDVNGKEVVNTWYFGYPPGLPPPEIALSQLIDAWLLGVASKYTQCMHQDYKLVEVIATDLGTLPQTSVSRLVSPVIPGTRPGAVSPGNVAVGIRRTTAHRGKSYRGRIEIPAIEKNDIARDIVSAALQAALVTLANAMLQALGSVNGGQFVPAVGSYKLVGSNPIVAWVFDLVADSQKTRLLGHGD